MEPVAILVARVFAPTMANRLMFVPPLRQAFIDVVLIGMDGATDGDGRLDERGNRLLLHIFNIVIRTSPPRCIIPNTGGFSVAKVPRPRAPLSRLRRALRPRIPSGRPLCPAITYTSSHSTSSSRRTFGRRATTPRRNTLVISWTSLSHRSNSWAICRLDKFKPIRYKQRIHTRKGW